MQNMLEVLKLNLLYRRYCRFLEYHTFSKTYTIIDGWAVLLKRKTLI